MRGYRRTVRACDAQARALRATCAERISRAGRVRHGRTDPLDAGKAHRVRLRVTRRAATQIERALDYIEAESPQGANRMRERIQNLFLLLARHPYAGQATDLPGVRRLSASPYPYLIFYRVTGEEVIVQRMRHTSRRLPSPSSAP